MIYFTVLQTVCHRNDWPHSFSSSMERSERFWCRHDDVKNALLAPWSLKTNAAIMIKTSILWLLF